MNTIIEEKKAMRKSMLHARNSLNSLLEQKYSNWICAQLEILIINSNSKSVHAYIPISNEIDISPLLQKLLDSNITVICPKTLPKRKLENRILHSLNQLETGIMGTKHPLQADIYQELIDFIIIPGLAFDKKKFRLGYGGGYYDNFLINHPKAQKVGIFFPFQQVDIVPTEPHDIHLDTILVKEF